MTSKILKFYLGLLKVWLLVVFFVFPRGCIILTQGAL